ncbi:MAG: ECF transporter S component [Streptosporangiales bacterium]|nr:ECF transporter S component [Streptosporangiales bacterium]
MSTSRSSDTEPVGFLQGVKSDFNTRAWVIIPVGVGINVALGAVVQALHLPIFLDVVGTILVAIMCGPWVAAVTGITTNVVMTAVNPIWICYAPLQAIIGIVAGILAVKGLMRTNIGRLVVGLILTVTAAVIAAPIIVATTGGAGGTGESAITAFFLATGDQIWSSVVKSKFIVEPIDKILSVFIAVLIIKVLPARYRTTRATRALTR